MAPRPFIGVYLGVILAVGGLFFAGIPAGVSALPNGIHGGANLFGSTALTSTNWAGYAVVGSAASVTVVRGSWIEPAFHGTCSSTTELAAFWVGIDGISSSAPTVEQTGTIIECVGGTVVHAAWWEMYPTNSIQVISTMTITAGDAIFAEVHYYSGAFHITLHDASTGKYFNTTQKCGTTACARLSAEWIAEAPCCSGSSVYPLANFGTNLWGKDHTNLTGTNDATISGVTRVMGKFTNLTLDEITMVSSTNAIKARPSAISSDGSSFKVVWKSAGP